MRVPHLNRAFAVRLGFARLALCQLDSRTLAPRAQRMSFSNICVEMPSCVLSLPCFSVLSPSAAQDKGYWRAASNNASAITGDLSISEAKLSINFTSFTIAHIRPAKAG